MYIMEKAVDEQVIRFFIPHNAKYESMFQNTLEAYKIATNFEEFKQHLELIGENLIDPYHFEYELFDEDGNKIPPEQYIEKYYSTVPHPNVNYIQTLKNERLSRAITLQSLSEIEEALNDGADIEPVEIVRIGYRPLFDACATGNLMIVEYLLHRGANPSRIDAY